MKIFLKWSVFSFTNIGLWIFKFAKIGCPDWDVLAGPVNSFLFPIVILAINLKKKIIT